MNSLSIVIVNYRTPALLRACLASIERHCPSSQTIVVDNGSGDSSAELVRREFPRVELVELAENRGFAGGNNAGLARCRGEFILLFNSDAELEDDSLSRCVNYLKHHPRMGAVSPRLIGGDGRPQQCLYRFPSARDRLRQALRQPSPSLNGSEAEEASEAFWLAGTALLIRRQALKEIGGFLDDGYFMYWEDADVSARLRRAGWGLAQVDDAWVRHHGGASGGGDDQRRRPDLQAWFDYGRHRFFAKNRSASESAAIWLLDAVEALRKLLRAGVRPDRRYEAAQAWILAKVLLRTLAKSAPPRPAIAKKRWRTRMD